MNLKNVYLVVDATTAQFLQSRGQSAVLDFTSSCIRGIAGEAVQDVAAWMQSAGAVPSVVQMPGTFPSGRIAEFLSDNCGCDHGWSLSNSDVLVKTGQTTFGGSFAVCLITHKTPQRPAAPQPRTAPAPAPGSKSVAESNVKKRWWEFWK